VDKGERRGKIEEEIWSKTNLRGSLKGGIILERENKRGVLGIHNGAKQPGRNNVVFNGGEDKRALKRPPKKRVVLQKESSKGSTQQ